MQEITYYTIAFAIITFNIYLMYHALKRDDVLSYVLSVLAILFMVYSLTSL